MFREIKGLHRLELKDINCEKWLKIRGGKPIWGGQIAPFNRPKNPVCTVWVTKKYPFFIKQRLCNGNFAFRFRARSVLHITVFIFAAWAKLF